MVANTSTHYACHYTISVQLLQVIDLIDCTLEKTLKSRTSCRTRVFRHKKTRYRGLAKNHAQLYSLFGLANLAMAKRRLLALHGGGAS